MEGFQLSSASLFPLLGLPLGLLFWMLCFWGHHLGEVMAVRLAPLSCHTAGWGGESTAFQPQIGIWVTQESCPSADSGSVGPGDNGAADSQTTLNSRESDLTIHTQAADVPISAVHVWPVMVARGAARGLLPRSVIWAQCPRLPRESVRHLTSLANSFSLKLDRVGLVNFYSRICPILAFPFGSVSVGCVEIWVVRNPISLEKDCWDRLVMPAWTRN